MQPYRERVWPGPLVWWAVLVVAGGLGLVALPLGTSAAIGTAGVSGVAMLAAVFAWSPEVSVDGDGLRVGAELLPVGAIEEIEVLDAEQMRSRRGPMLDARTRTVLRPGPAGGVAVRTAQRQWLVSCRHPDRVRAALRG